MKILIVTQNFPPDIGGASIRLAGYAKYLNTFGYKVTVLCASPIYPRGKIFEGYKNKWFQKEEKDGYTIVRTWIWPVKPKSHAILRILSYCSFTLSACFGSLKLEKPDIIVSATPSFFASFISIFYKKLKKIKIILDITDVWPDAALATGFMKKNLFFWLAKKIELWIYWNVDHLTCGSIGIKRELLKNYWLENKITIIPDAADLELFPLNLNSDNVKKEYNLEDKFIIGFAGLLGFAQQPTIIARVAKKLEPYQNIKFLIVGNGGLKNDFEALAKELNLNNIIFAGEKPRNIIASYINAFDVGLSTLANKDFLRNSVPAKIFEYLACGLPIVINLKGVAWEIVNEAKAGVLADEDNAEDLANQILYLYNHKDEALKMGENGRAYAHENYDRKKIVKKLERVINSTLMNTQKPSE